MTVHLLFQFCRERTNILMFNIRLKSNLQNLYYMIVNIKKLLISKKRIGILKKLPKQGEDSESL